MKATEPKKKTAKGKPIGRFTMLVFFKREYQKVNEKTGELFTKWTYRADLEIEKMKRQGRFFEREQDALSYIFERDKHKYTRVVSYDNFKEDGQILREFLLSENGILQRVF